MKKDTLVQPVKTDALALYVHGQGNAGAVAGAGVAGDFMVYTLAYKLLTCIGLVVACVFAMDFIIKIYHVGNEQAIIVQRYRDVAGAELRNECCVIFYGTDHGLPTKWPAQKIEDCMRTLSHDKHTRKNNRCEDSQMVLSHTFLYQVALEIWGYYLPFTKISISDWLVYTFTGASSVRMLNSIMLTLFKYYRRVVF